ncbi:MAG: tripartite tricarboxylate transporter permease [Paracoccus sp. (in: a-proteobacteria)]|uniref:tripartite tricarboxylate transporter permease n=1 Tax=unclassified Paracoccus (in: a-proteobacteria) TaxID=2688777 RepID=UPI000C54E569|nr:MULTISPECIES: tripartite tricarboxylate transporter permease [unclassified Paracoccus (in: a-proteobacteria)]MBA49975.1 transporter [Paracoccus sp. (in: a-proteobacteria)]|tara:strand:+ start:2004 stop:3509 length:1506 start_codon:yes stop_codon:yes gene_type:complete
MIDAFIQVLQPWLLLVAFGGVSLGIIWGALPGLSTTMAMALLISLSTGLEQSSAIVFMLGVYTGSVFGGAISAVLINIPGTPDAVPTMIEGHALAKRGEGGQALGMAIAGSFVGNWVGILLLVAFIPLVLSFALQFRSWEMALLGMIGISICGSMACGAMPLKGWIAGWLGILVALVGFDPIHAVQRYTFGVPELMDGVNYVSVLIGLFGLTEILKVMPSRAQPVVPESVGRVIPSLRKLARYSVAAVRSGVIGAVTGAIPGAGANVASFLSYDIGRRMASPEEKAKWGKGSYEAIVCAEVANNANIGGSMLPTLTLGIPGNAAAAALLAALALNNIVVGPAIEVDHPGLIYFIYAALIVANLLMYVAAIGLIKPCVKLFSLPRAVLLALIVPICVIGAYSVRLSMFDVWVMFVSGLAGLALRQLKFPVAPIVLGVILAPMVDENLRRALLVFEGRSFGFVVQQWVGTVLVIALLAIFAEGLLRLRRSPGIPQGEPVEHQG